MTFPGFIYLFVYLFCVFFSWSVVLNEAAPHFSVSTAASVSYLNKTLGLERPETRVCRAQCTDTAEAWVPLHSHTRFSLTTAYLIELVMFFFL